MTLAVFFLVVHYDPFAVRDLEGVLPLAIGIMGLEVLMGIDRKRRMKLFERAIGAPIPEGVYE